MDLNDLQNLTLSQGREALQYADSFNRMTIMIGLSWRMESPDWLVLLGEYWSSCDNISEHAWHLQDTPFGELIEDPIGLRDAMMTPEERAKLALLPERVTIFRGCYANNKRGFSWSLDKGVATKFPSLHRYQQNGQALLVRATIARDQVLALKLDREEIEIIAYRPNIQAIQHVKKEPTPH